MFNVKAFDPTRWRFSDLARRLFYETLPIGCLAVLWTLAWAQAYVLKVHHDLGPRQTFPALVNLQQSTKLESPDLAPPTSPQTDSQLTAIDTTPIEH